MARKTFEVEALKNRINAMIHNSVDSAQGERIALQLVIEGVLMDTGNYKGFGYLTEEDMRTSSNGTTYGIDRSKGKDQFVGMDHTRVHYF